MGRSMEDGGGDANAVFLFQIGSALTTIGRTQVLLSGGTPAKNARLLTKCRAQKVGQLPTIHVFIWSLAERVMSAGQYDGLVIEFVPFEFLDDLL